jgi:hypothetical protein
MRLLNVSLVLCFFWIPLSSQGQDNPVTDKNFVPIKDIVRVVETSLDVVKAQLQPTDPQLKSAEFDFQTVTTKDISGGLFASVVAIEAEHAKIATRETDFTYSVPDKDKALQKLQSLKANNFDAKLSKNCSQDLVSMVTCLWNNLNETTNPVQVAEILPASIVAAAQAARDVSRVRNSTGTTDLTHREFVIILTYQVKNSFAVGADPSSLISVGPKAKFSDEVDRTQTLKLTFEDPKK